MPAVQHVHPILVHFPIVLIYTLVVIDLVALAGSNAVTMRSGVGTISTFVAVAAGLFAVGTWLFGGMALDYAEAAGFSSEIAEIHESLGEITAFTFVAWAFIRLALWVRWLDSGRVRKLAVVAGPANGSWVGERSLRRAAMSAPV